MLLYAYSHEHLEDGGGKEYKAKLSYMWLWISLDYMSSSF